MVQRYNPDYVMHAARFAPFARENEQGEFVKFSDYEALLSELASSRQINAQTLLVKLTMAETIKKLTDRVNVLTLENAGFKHALSVILEHVDVTDKGQAGVVAMIANDELFNSETPATDAALAAIQAQGVEKYAADLDQIASESNPEEPKHTVASSYADDARSFAKKLREAK